MSRCGGSRHSNWAQYSRSWPYPARYSMAGSLRATLLCPLNELQSASCIAESTIAIDEQVDQWLINLVVATAGFVTAMGDDWERLVDQFLRPLGADAAGYTQRISRKMP
jgi:hypothetical protein